MKPLQTITVFSACDNGKNGLFLQWITVDTATDNGKYFFYFTGTPYLSRKHVSVGPGLQ